MKTLQQNNAKSFAIFIALLVLIGFNMPSATAQNYNDNYNNNNQGYNNNGYNDQNNQGYNDQNNNQGYNNNDYNDQNYNNQQGYDNGYNNSYDNNYNNGYSNNGYDNGDYREFYNDLAPYGQWLSDPQYGYVWTPYNVGRGFRPYYDNGYWVMTEYGNTWVSNYPWGWAAFHYGRWAQSNFYGWVWIPGNTWGPAWVNWRQGGGYYGWAPMGPGISISFSFGSGYDVPNPWWTFIPCGNIYARNYGRYYSPRQTVNIINNTTIINNTYVDNRTRNTYVTGPRRADIEATARIKVPVYQVNNAGARGATQVKGQNVSLYRPTINRISSAEQVKIAPTQVKRLETSAVTNLGGGRAPARVNPAITNRVNAPANNGTLNTRQNTSGVPQQTQRISPDPNTKINQPAFDQQQRSQQANSQQELQRDQAVRQQQNQQLQQQKSQQQLQLQQQQAQQQRQQQQQLQLQQQKAQQAQQQVQLQQQRVQQQQQQQQLQQQRAQQAQQQQQAQMQQQRVQQQQQQMQQQRAQQMQQQQMQQQRAQQAQQQQRAQQVQQQQRVQQQQQVQRAAPPAPKAEPAQRER